LKMGLVQNHTGGGQKLTGGGGNGTGVLTKN